MLQKIVTNYSGNVRRETLNGQEYYVAPLSMIVPGVLNGSHGPLLYTKEEIARNVDAWNGMPIVVNHPHGSARDPNVLEKRGIGFVFRSRIKNGKLVAEGWFDIKRTKLVDARILTALATNQPLELSTGLMIEKEPSKGNYMGKSYTYIAKNYRPDHLAVLPDNSGACSISDGCGVLVNQRNGISLRKGLSKPLVIPTMNFGGSDESQEYDLSGPLVIPTMNFESSTTKETSGKECKCPTKNARSGPLVIPRMTF